LRKTFILLLLSIILIIQVFAQNRTIVGKISDEKGQPLAGVSINALGAYKKVIATAVSGSNGEYTIHVGESVKGLQFSHIGLDEQYIPIGNKGVINLSLSAASKDLSKVVVT
jgi:hypothetical protein